MYRVARTKATPTSGPTGINELEGSVLLEADDYRRISNEVKSIKTALLKLKREIQADVSVRACSCVVGHSSIVTACVYFLNIIMLLLCACKQCVL